MTHNKISNVNLGRLYNHLIVKYSIDYVGHGVSLSRLVEEGKQEVERALNDFIADQGYTIEIYVSWRLKSRFHNLVHYGDYLMN